MVTTEGATRILSLFPTSRVSTIILPVIIHSFSPIRPQAFSSSTTNSLTLVSGPNRTFLLSAAAVVAGAAIRGTCFRAMKKLYTFSHTTLSEHTLVKSGPYAIVRHPAYVGTVLVRSGMVCLLFSTGSLADTLGVNSLVTVPLLPWESESPAGIFSSALRISLGLYAGYSIFEQIWLLSRSRREDETLRRKFGAEWEEYRKKVPYRFIPFVI